MQVSSTPARCDVTFVKSLEWGDASYCIENSNNLNCRILADNTGTKYKGVVTSDTLFEHISPADGTEDGLWLENRFLKTESYMPVYFFRGNVTNNKVIFAGKYWRIVRINEDGSVRLILGGNTTTDGYAYNGATQLTTGFSYNNLDNRNSYVGYKYGSSCESGNTYADCHANINKSGLMTTNETWWDNNLSNSTYNSKISKEAIYCNDRSLSTGTGVGTTATNYKAYERLVKYKTPQFMCQQDNDKFTGTNSSGIGNQELEEKTIGFLTADEYAYAGGLHATTSEYNYLYQNAQVGSNRSVWWLGSPFWFDGFGSNVVQISGVGNLDWNYVGDYSAKFRPVISLKADTVVTSGTSTTAYSVD